VVSGDLAHLEFEVGFDSRVAPLFHWANCLLTLPPQFLRSKKLWYKRDFSAP